MATKTKKTSQPKAAKIAGMVKGTPALNKEPDARPAAKPAAARPAAVIGNAPFRVKSMREGTANDWYLKGRTWTAERSTATTFDTAEAAQAAIAKVAKTNPRAAKTAAIVGQAVPPPVANPAAEGAAAAKADDAERDALRKAGKPLPARLTGKKAAKAPEKAAKAPRQPGGKRAAILAAAQAGKLPEAPDWTKRTHYRKTYEGLVAAAKTADIATLRKIEINPGVSQLVRYRELAMVAIEAQRAQGRKPLAR